MKFVESVLFTLDVSSTYTNKLLDASCFLVLNFNSFPSLWNSFLDFNNNNMRGDKQ